MTRRPTDNYTLRRRQERLAQSPLAASARAMLTLVEAGQVHHVSHRWTRADDVRMLRSVGDGLSIAQVAADFCTDPEHIRKRMQTLLRKPRPGRGIREE